MNLSTKNNYVSPHILHLSTYLGSFNKKIMSNIIMVYLVHLNVSHRLIYWNTVFILLEMRCLKDNWNSPNQSAANCILFLSRASFSFSVFSLSDIILLPFFYIFSESDRIACTTNFHWKSTKNLPNYRKQSFSGNLTFDGVNGWINQTRLQHSTYRSRLGSYRYILRTHILNLLLDGSATIFFYTTVGSCLWNRHLVSDWKKTF